MYVGLDDLSEIVWPSWSAGDLWRWMMLIMGLLLIAHGLSSTKMRMRDNSSWHGLWFGKIVKKQWQIIYMRTLFVVIGIGCVLFAFGNGFAPRP